jgi:N-acetylneuraminic acid mutarotase
MIEGLEQRTHLHGYFPVTVDFAPAGSAIAGGTVADTGLVYGARPGDYDYGWTVDSTANATERDAASNPYQRNRTFIDMLQGGPRSWNLHVHSGRYRITVGAGDPSAFGGLTHITAEGRSVVNATTTSSTRLLRGTVEVAVTDGDITLGNGAGAAVNKVGFVTIEYVGPITTPVPDPTPTPTPTGTINWTTRASNPVARSEAFGATINGKLYLFGGYRDTTFRPTTDARVYDPATNAWSAIRSLPVALTHVAHADDGRFIYFAGGYPAGTSGGQFFATSAVRRYDPATNSYASLPSLPQARGSGAMTLAGRSLYFMGGNDSARKDRAEAWTLNLDNLAAGWRQIASIPKALNHPAAASVGGQVYFISGQTSQDAAAVMSNQMWRYNASGNAWQQVASLPVQRSHVTSSTFTRNGEIIVIGGESSHNKALRDVQAYNPVTNTWRQLGQLPAARFSGVAGLLADGSIIFSTGYTGGAFSATTWIGRIG